MVYNLMIGCGKLNYSLLGFDFSPIAIKDINGVDRTVSSEDLTKNFHIFKALAIGKDNTPWSFSDYCLKDAYATLQIYEKINEEATDTYAAASFLGKYVFTEDVDIGEIGVLGNIGSDITFLVDREPLEPKETFKKDEELTVIIDIMVE